MATAESVGGLHPRASSSKTPHPALSQLHMHRLVQREASCEGHQRDSQGEKASSWGRPLLPYLLHRLWTHPFAGLHEVNVSEADHLCPVCVALSGCPGRGGVISGPDHEPQGALLSRPQRHQTRETQLLTAGLAPGSSSQPLGTPLVAGGLVVGFKGRIIFTQPRPPEAS